MKKYEVEVIRLRRSLRPFRIYGGRELATLAKCQLKSLRYVLAHLGFYIMVFRRRSRKSGKMEYLFVRKT